MMEGAFLVMQACPISRTCQHAGQEPPHRCHFGPCPPCQLPCGKLQVSQLAHFEFSMPPMESTLATFERNAYNRLHNVCNIWLAEEITLGCRTVAMCAPSAIATILQCRRCAPSSRRRLPRQRAFPQLARTRNSLWMTRLQHNR
jgi:hypothetical protein